MEPSELMEWLKGESSKLRVKYTHPDDRHASYDKRQQVGLGDSGADNYYFAPIGIGTPLRTLDVVLDTGSSDFWLADTACTEEQNCPSGMVKYDSSNSSTYEDVNIPFMMQYGTGAVKGTMAKDAVSLAGYNISSVSFGQASHLAKDTMRPPASGIMGMGFDTLSITRTKPFWQILTERHMLHDYLFSFQLATNIGSVKSVDEINLGGVFTLGVLDSQQYSGNITWVPLSKGYGPDGLGHWAIDIDSMRVNGETVDMQDMGVAAIDTGTTLIGGPRQLVEQIHSMIPGAQALDASMDPLSDPFMERSFQHYTFPCKNKFELEFVFGGRAFKLTNEDLNLGKVSPFSSNCMSAIFVSPTQPKRMPSWIIGDTFLKTVFSAFGSSPPNVGFANLPKDGAQTLPLTSVPMPSSSQDEGESPIGGAGGGGGGGPPLGGGSVMTLKLNTDTSWKTASVDVPDNLQTQRPDKGPFDSASYGMRPRPWVASLSVCLVAALIAL